MQWKISGMIGALLMCGMLSLAMPERVSAADPRRGGEVTWFTSVAPESLDPHRVVLSSAQQVIAGFYSSLLRYDPSALQVILPDLAERWEVSAEGKVYTLHLRQGVSWHDGMPFTAADVTATFARLLAPAFRRFPCGAWLQRMIERVQALDEHTVQVDLTSPTAAFLAIVASGWCPIVARHVIESDPELVEVSNQIGTGPFRLETYKPGREMVWVRNPHYYDSNYPYLDKVAQLFLPQRGRQFSAARFGQVNLWGTEPPMSSYQAQILKKSRGDEVEVYSQPLNSVWAIHLNASKLPFSNPAMRRAVFLALDRQGLLDASFKGTGTPCTMLDPAVYGKWALPQEEVDSLAGCRQSKVEDLAEAKRLVEIAYPNGVEVNIVVRAVDDYLERAQLIASQLSQVGIRGRLKVYSSAVGWQRYQRGAYDIIGTEDTVVKMRDPSAPFSLFFAPQGRYNWSQWQDARVAQLLRLSTQEQEPVRRQRFYHELQRYLLTQDTASVVIGWKAGHFFRDPLLHLSHRAPSGVLRPNLMGAWWQASEAEIETPQLMIDEKTAALIDKRDELDIEEVVVVPVRPVADVQSAVQGSESELPSQDPTTPATLTTSQIASALLASAPPPRSTDCLLRRSQGKPCDAESAETTPPLQTDVNVSPGRSTQAKSALAEKVRGATLGLVTGLPDSSYLPLGREIARLAEQEELTFLVKMSGGPIDNIRRLGSKENTSLAIVPADVLRYWDDAQAKVLAEKFRVVFPLHNEVVHILARREIRELSDLESKRVIVGLQGSRHWLTAINLLRVFEIKPAQSIRKVPGPEAILAVLTGTADAMFYVGAKPAKLFQRINDLKEDPRFAALVPAVHFLPVASERIPPEYVASSITSQDYAWVDGKVPAIAVQAMLISYDFSAGLNPYYRMRCRQLGQLGQVLRRHAGKLNVDNLLLTWKRDECAMAEAAPTSGKN